MVLNNGGSRPKECLGRRFKDLRYMPLKTQVTLDEVVYISYNINNIAIRLPGKPGAF